MAESQLSRGKRPDAEGYAVGAREWLEASRQAGEKMAAAFDRARAWGAKLALLATK